MTETNGLSLSAFLAGRLRGDRARELEHEERVHAELRSLAEAQLRTRSARDSIQPTALVHEAWLRFQSSGELTFADRKAFFAFAAAVMRSILVDRARAAATLRRGGDRAHVTLSGEVVGDGAQETDLLALEEALQRLGALDPESARLVELRFFGGLSHPEIAELMGSSLRQVERRWRFARAWLHSELSE